LFCCLTSDFNRPKHGTRSKQGTRRSGSLFPDIARRELVASTVGRSPDWWGSKQMAFPC